MNAQSQLNLIISKIEDLKTAVLHNCSTGVLNIPSGIVNTLHVDNTGCIWFTIYKPMQYIAEFDRRFPVELDYYQKGRPFYLNIIGMARIIIDPEEVYALPDEIKNGLSPDKILVCVRITAASYHAYKSDLPRNPFSQLKGYLSSLFAPNHWHINFDNPGYMA
jgi:hypothetical protein